MPELHTYRIRVAFLAVIVTFCMSCEEHGAEPAPVVKLTGHTLPIEALAYSPDGRLAVSGSRDETVRLWDLQSGKELRRFAGHTEQVVAVAFSPDGKLIASGSGDRNVARLNPKAPNDCSVRVWDVTSGKEVQRLEAHTFEACSVTFSPDGRTLASGGADRLCILWDVETGRERVRLPARNGPVESLTFSPDGGRLLCATSTRAKAEISLWNAGTAELIRTYGEAFMDVSCVAFSADGELIATGHDGRLAPPSGSLARGRDLYPDCSVRIWETRSGKLLHRFAWKDSGPADVAFSPGANRVGAISPGTIRMWKLPEGQALPPSEVEGGSSPAVLRVLPRGFIAITDNVDIFVYQSLSIAP